LRNIRGYTSSGCVTVEDGQNGIFGLRAF